MPAAAVVFNPTKLTREELAAVIDPVAAAAGYGETLWFETTAEDPGAGQAAEAARQGVDVVLAVGGDGTVRAVGEGLRGTRVPLGICPRGTGNLLARNLGIPLDDLSAAVGIALTGRSHEVDLGRARWLNEAGEPIEHAFLVMAGLGLDARIMSRTDEELKKRAGMLAYVKTGAVEVSRNRRMSLTYRLDGGRERRSRAQMLVVGNCGSIGYNVYLMPDAAVDDGLLDVVLAKPVGLLGWLLVGWRVLVANTILRRLPTKAPKRDDPVYAYLQGTSLDVSLKHPQEMELDGDPVGMAASVTFRIDPGALLVRVPE
ncbi:MAG: diacylglycerol kinase family lipid kinase [Arachnia sp.]